MGRPNFEFCSDGVSWLCFICVFAFLNGFCLFLFVCANYQWAVLCGISFSSGILEYDFSNVGMCKNPLEDLLRLIDVSWGGSDSIGLGWGP